MRLIRNLFRASGEAASSACKNPLMTLASVLVVTFCLFIFGVFIILTMNANYLGEKIEEQCEIVINLSEDIVEQADFDAIEEKISEKKQYISSITFETGPQRFADFKAGLKENELERFESVPDTIFGSSFTVTLNDISKARELVQYFENMDFGERKFGELTNPVTSVDSELELMNSIQSVTGSIKWISMWIVIIFAVISVFIISNTIKLTLYSRRKEIEIMKYVGATDAFIRAPLVIEGMLVGLVAACVSYLVTSYGYGAFRDFINSFEISSAAFSLEPFKDMQWILVGSYAGMGVGLGCVGSMISIRRYLKA